MKKAAIILLKLAVTVGLLWMIFREHRFTETILPHLRALFNHWDWTLGGLVCVGISIWLSAVRWQILLKGQEQSVPAGEVLRVTVVSRRSRAAQRKNASSRGWPRRPAVALPGQDSFP